MGPDENEESAADLEAWAGAAPGTQVVRRPRRRRLGAEVTEEVAALARRPRHRDRVALPPGHHLQAGHNQNPGQAPPRWSRGCAAIIPFPQHLGKSPTRMQRNVGHLPNTAKPKALTAVPSAVVCPQNTTTPPPGGSSPPRSRPANPVQIACALLAPLLTPGTSTPLPSTSSPPSKVRALPLCAVSASASAPSL